MKPYSHSHSHLNIEMDSIYAALHHIKRYAEREPDLDRLSKVLDVLRDVERGIIKRISESGEVVLEK